MSSAMPNKLGPVSNIPDIVSTTQKRLASWGVQTLPSNQLIRTIVLLKPTNTVAPHDV
jgi:hypothetical protein